MRKCPCCAGQQFDTLGTIKMRLPKGCPLPEQYPILHCRSCGMCYAGTMATEQDYDRYYQEFNWYGGSGKNNTPVERWTELIERILPKTAEILDIGFGTGKFLLSLKQAGFQNLHGLDPSAESVEALQKHGIDAAVGSVYHLDLEQKFDLVILTGVLEHLLYPEKAVNQIAHSLNPGGRFFLSFPDYSAIAASDFPIPHFFNQEHINYFSTESLNHLMGAYSFQLECRDVGGDCEYTDYVAVYRAISEDAPSPQTALPADECTAPAIRAYLNRMGYELNKTRVVIQCLRGEGKQLWVWGCGAYLGYLLANTELQSCQIAGFIDSNPLKQGWEIIPGKTPLQPQNAAIDSNHAVLIASMGGHEDIRARLLKMGHQGTVIVL